MPNEITIEDHSNIGEAHTSLSERDRQQYAEMTDEEVAEEILFVTRQPERFKEFYSPWLTALRDESAKRKRSAGIL